MRTDTLTDHNVHATLLNALSFAADGYRTIAGQQRNAESEARTAGDRNGEAVCARLADQFLGQAVEADALRDRIEAADEVVLRTDSESFTEYVTRTPPTS